MNVFVYYTMSDNDNKSDLLNLRNTELYMGIDKIRFLSHDNACIRSNNIPITYFFKYITCVV